jgi:hypothetical protein
MKFKILIISLVFGGGLGLSWAPVANAKSLAAVSPEIVWAQVDQNLPAGVKTIQLILLRGNSAPKPPAPLQPDQWIVRTVGASRSSQVNVMRYKGTIELALGALKSADLDPVITKVRDFTCRVTLLPTPQLEVLRYSYNTEASRLETVLTNQSCAYHEWRSPQSAQGEEAAMVLYSFLLDSVSPQGLSL